MSQAPRPGKGPLCMPRGGAGSHKAPSMCLDVQALVSDTGPQVGTETGLRRVGRVSSTLQRVSVFFLTMDLSTPSTHPAHT